MVDRCSSTISFGWSWSSFKHYPEPFPVNRCYYGWWYRTLFGQTIYYLCAWVVKMLSGVGSCRLLLCSAVTLSASCEAAVSHQLQQPLQTTKTSLLPLLLSSQQLVYLYPVWRHAGNFVFICLFVVFFFLIAQRITKASLYKKKTNKKTAVTALHTMCWEHLKKNKKNKHWHSVFCWHHLFQFQLKKQRAEPSPNVVTAYNYRHTTAHCQ